MNYLSPETKKKKKKRKVVSSLPPVPKQTSQNWNYFKTCASELPFSHSVPVPSQSPWRDLHPHISYHARKLSVQFLLNAIVHCHSLVHLSFYHFIHTGTLYPLTITPRCSCSTHSTIHTSLTFIITSSFFGSPYTALLILSYFTISCFLPLTR